MKISVSRRPLSPRPVLGRGTRAALFFVIQSCTASHADVSIGALRLTQQRRTGIQKLPHLLGAASDVALRLHQLLQLPAAQAEGRIPRQTVQQTQW